MSVTAKVKTITPAMAKRFLEHNTTNRRISRTRVSQYARDMKAGHWLVNHQGIGFDESGTLIDGQHRLEAIVEADIPIDMIVTNGLKPSSKNGIVIHTMDTVDRGRPRQVGEQLQLRHGYQYGNQVAAAAKVIAEICFGGPIGSVSTSQTLRLLDIYGNAINECLSEVQIQTDRKAGMIGTLAFCRANNKDLGGRFCAALFGMDNLSKNHPVLALRKWIGNHHNNGSQERWALVKVVASAINNFATDTPIVKIYQSETALEWLRNQQKANVKLVCEMLS